VSRPYLALDGIYHLLNTVLTNSATLRRRDALHNGQQTIAQPALHRAVTFSGVLFQATYAVMRFKVPAKSPTPLDYNSASPSTGLQIFSLELLPLSLAVTPGIIVIFFSSA